MNYEMFRKCLVNVYSTAYGGTILVLPSVYHGNGPFINDFPIQDGDFTRGYIPVIGGFFHEIPMKYREYLFGSVLPHLPTMSFCFWHPLSGLCQSEPPRAVHVSPRITGAKSKNCNPRPLQNDCLYVARPLIEMTSRDWIRMCCWLFPWNLRQKQNLRKQSDRSEIHIRDQWNCRWFPHWHTPLTSDFYRAQVLHPLISRILQHLQEGDHQSPWLVTTSKMLQLWMIWGYPPFHKTTTHIYIYIL